MAHENLQVVRLILGAWEHGDFRSPAALLDPEIRFETFMPDAGENVTARGLREVEDFTRNWLAQWREYRIVPDEFREVGPEKVFVSVRQRGSGRRSGAAVDSPGFCVFTLRDGKVANLSLHYDREEAIEASGDRTEDVARER